MNSALLQLKMNTCIHVDYWQKSQNTIRCGIFTIDGTTFLYDLICFDEDFHVHIRLNGSTFGWLILISFLIKMIHVSYHFQRSSKCVMQWAYFVKLQQVIVLKQLSKTILSILARNSFDKVQTDSNNRHTKEKQNWLNYPRFKIRPTITIRRVLDLECIELQTKQTEQSSIGTTPQQRCKIERI